MRPAIHPAVYIFFIFLGVILLMCVCTAQEPVVTQTGTVFREQFELQRADSVVRLSREFIIAGSEHISIDSQQLTVNKHYLLDARKGIIYLFPNSFISVILDTSTSYRLNIAYRALPFTFKPKYFHQEPFLLTDSGAVAKQSRPLPPFTFDDVFGSNLQKNGSIVRGFSIGSNRDLSLNSGFRMQMSGNISDDLEITAALTDENSPIQPEGTTQTLQEFDKVFVELRGSDINGTFGDFMLNVSGGEFANLNRKLQGARGAGQYKLGDVQGNLMLTGAVTRGKYLSKQFQGIDGVQGPYRLTGGDGERNIIIIAGTERVYINGEQMARGENNEYIIDYATGEVFFTTRRLISHSSRITIDYEYTDRQFNRSLIGGQTGVGLFNNRFQFNATMVKESDDEDSPIDNALTEADKDTLRFAGDDRQRASRDGAVYVGPGKGQYASIDTSVFSPVANQFIQMQVYLFAPFDSLNATYAVTFSFVGNGHADYEKISTGHYRFVGIGSGSYAPIRYLPLPQSKSLIDIGMTGTLSEDLKVSAEFAASNFDANRFSSMQDDDNNGTAMKFSLNYYPKDLVFGQTNIGSLNLTLNERRVQRKFVSLDRFNEVEFERKWNIADSANVDEAIHEGTIRYQPIHTLTFTGGAGRIARGDIFASNRYTAGINHAQPGLPTIDYTFESVQSEDRFRLSDDNWIRHGGMVMHKSGFITPLLEYKSETLRKQNTSGDTLATGSFRFNEIIPGVIIDTLANMALNINVGLRWDDSLSGGVLQHVSRTITQAYGWQLYEWNNLSSKIDMTFQERLFTEQFRQRNGKDRTTALVRWQTRYNPFQRGLETDWFYEAASEQAAKLERVFQRVQRGTGNYIYAGDLNSNGIVDDQDFQLTRFDGDFIAVTVPADALTPVVDVKASTRIRVTPKRFLSAGGWLSQWISALSSETYLRVEERSSDTETRNIYFLHVSKFMNDLTTISGSTIVNQDFYVRENNPDFSLRLRFNQRRGFAQFATLNERTYIRERSVRVRWQFLQEIANQIDVIEKTDNLSATQYSPRARCVYSTSVISDWSYRPIQDIEVGFKIEVGQAENYDSLNADINMQSIRCIYSIRNKGQVKAEFSREEVLLDRPVTLIPFELTNGKTRGKTWLWRFGLDYRLTEFIQGSMTYDGRSEMGLSPVHTAKAEVRAFF